HCSVFKHPASTATYALSLHDALPISALVIGGGPIGLLIALVARARGASVLVVEPDEARRALAHELGFDALAADGDVGSAVGEAGDRKSTRLNSSHSQISYAVFCLKKK